MAIELIAAIVAAIAFAGIALIIRKIFKSAPKWLVPVAAGLGLIIFTIWSEYDWFGRVSSELPQGVEVVWTQEEPSPLRPWTFVFPLTTKFIAMDVANIKAHPANADLRMATVFNLARWQPVRDALMVFDCGAGRQVLVTEGVSFSDAGELVGAEWVTPTGADGFQAAACRNG